MALFGLCLSAGVSLADIVYMSEHGDTRDVDTFNTPNSSHYFVYEEDSIYLAHVEGVPGALKKISYRDHKFQYDVEGSSPKAPLEYSMSRLMESSKRDFKDWKRVESGLIDRTVKVLLRQEETQSCGRVEYYVEPDPRGHGINNIEVVLPGRGRVDLGLEHLEYLHCNADGTVVAGIVSCSRGCTQYLIGFDTGK